MVAASRYDSNFGNAELVTNAAAYGIFLSITACLAFSISSATSSSSVSFFLGFHPSKRRTTRLSNGARLIPVIVLTAKSKVKFRRLFPLQVSMARRIYLGGKERNKHRSKRKKRHIGGVDKEMVLSLGERGGKVRSMHLPSVSAENLRPVLKAQIDAGCRRSDPGCCGPGARGGRRLTRLTSRISDRRCC
jgi:hypothetical protein